MNPAQTLERVSDVAEVASLTGLVRIFEPDIQLCHLPRSPDPLIERYLAAAAPRLGEGFRQVVEVRQGCAAELLPDLPGRQALVNDMAFIVAVYGDLLSTAPASDCSALTVALVLNGWSRKPPNVSGWVTAPAAWATNTPA
jgi:hypothetical protein